MFHSSHIHIPNRHRQRTALRTFFPSSSFSPPDSKEPLRRGILFSSVACVLLLVGCILTWLESNDMFGGKISMTGSLLIALAVLLILLSLRQFHLARKRNRPNNGAVQLESVGSNGVTAVVVDQDGNNTAATVVVDTWDADGPQNLEDFSPPSYTDIGQLSCSSNCPSFISHDDRNEAPPTYEETCGVIHFGSDTSLSNSVSRQCTVHLDPSSSRKCTGDGFLQNDPHCHGWNSSSQLMKPGNSQPRRSSNTLCPSSALLTIASKENRPSLDSSKQNVGPQHHYVQTNVSETAACVDPNVSANDERVTSVLSSLNIVPNWSRRSFSSVPSYTCLLSESGEVSAHVYNTNSIIAQMMPDRVYQDESTEACLNSQSMMHTRSHSTSSISNLRKGVPYSLQTLYSSTSSNNISLKSYDPPETQACTDGSDLSKNLIPSDILETSNSKSTMYDSYLLSTSSVTPSSQVPDIEEVFTTTSDNSQSHGPNHPQIATTSYNTTEDSYAQTAVPISNSQPQGARTNLDLPAQILFLNTLDIQETI